MKCAAHPNVETNLRCGKCGKPICPKCLVMTPVGARCPECAKVRRPVTYQVPPVFYLRALGAGLVSGVVLGIVWSFLPFVGFYGLFTLVISAGVGFLIGEAISRSVNRKRGLGLQVIAGVCVTVAYVLQSLASSLLGSPIFLWNVGQLVSLYGLAGLALGIGVAVSRLH